MPAGVRVGAGAEEGQEVEEEGQEVEEVRCGVVWCDVMWSLCVFLSPRGCRQGVRNGRAVGP